MNQIVKVNSWTIINNAVFIKQMDKSSFNHDGTGIPKKIQKYWSLDNMKPSSKVEIELLYNDRSYNAYIYCDPLGRTRLHWHSDMRNIIHEKYFELSILYKDGSEVDQSPQMQFIRISEYKYEVDFLETMFISNYEEIKESDELYNTERREGKIVYSYSRRYERNPKIREKAIKYHGLQCKACGFIFKNVYGDLGDGYIEIHHNKPLYKNGKEVVVDYKEDLCPVCSNCHRMLHRNRNEIVSIEELRIVIDKNRFIEP